MIWTSKFNIRLTDFKMNVKTNILDYVDYEGKRDHINSRFTE